MQDIYQEILLHNDVDSLKNMYFVNKQIHRLLNTSHMIKLLNHKFHTYSNHIHDFFNQAGMLTIPNKSRYKKELDDSYFTHHNGEQLYNIRVKDGTVAIHTEGWERRDDESSDDFPWEDIERQYRSVPLLLLKPEMIFIGRDPFNNHEDHIQLYNFNPNNNDPDFYKYAPDLKHHYLDLDLTDDDITDFHLTDDDVTDYNVTDSDTTDGNVTDGNVTDNLTDGVIDNGVTNSDETDEYDSDMDSEEFMTEYNKGYYYAMDRSGFDGSTVLLHLKNLDYLFIDAEIYEFTALSKIVSFISCEGNADVPYAHAVDEYNNIYLFCIDYIAPDVKGMIIKMNNELSLQWKPTNDQYHINPYHYYFFKTTDEEKQDQTRFIPIVSTKTYFNGMDKYRQKDKNVL